MRATVDFAKSVGYTDEQAELIGKLDDLVEQAVLLDMCTSVEAKTIGVYCGQIFGMHTGTLKNQIISMYSGR